MYRDGPSTAVMGSRVVAIAGLSVALALSLSFLVAARHLFVLLDGAMSFIHFAVPVVLGRPAAVVGLAVHAGLIGNAS